MSAQRPRKNGDGRFMQTVVSPGSNQEPTAARISDGCTAGRSRADLGLKHNSRRTTPHSCPFVVQKTPVAKPLQDRSPAGKPDLHSFVSIRVHSWFKKHPSRSLFGTDLGLESPSYFHSWFIRGSKQPLAKPLRDRSPAGKPELHEFVPIRVHSWFKKHPSRSPFTTNLGLESPTCIHSCPFMFIRGSKNTPREASSRQISGRRARAAFIRSHACPFVVQNRRRATSAHKSTFFS